MKEQNKVREITAEEITYDDRNLNRHTDEGRDLVDKSFSELGAGRSGVSDRNGKMVAGNLSAETAIKKGLKILEVETEGDTYVIVKRKDLDLDSKTDNRARKLAFADNSTSAVSLDWDFEEMARQEDDFGFDVGEWGVIEPIQIEEPGYDELIGENKDKPPTLKVTFPTPDDLQKCESHIQEVLNRLCPDAYYSVSAGEI